MSRASWGGLGLAPSEDKTLSLGSLRLSLRRRAEEVWMHATHGSGGEGISHTGQPDGVPDEAWIRWALPAAEELELQPALPDRLVVVSPEQPFFLPPEGRARIFVRVPLFVRVSTQGRASEAATLEEFPSLVLSDTWWGTFTEGELGYWLGTRARRAVVPDIYEPHLAICPFVLVNRSTQPLPVERFAVRVAYLTLFGRGDRVVWTDEVQVRYEGGHEGSEIRYTGRVPDDAGEVRLLAASREPPPRGFHARTFGMLKARMASL